MYSWFIISAFIVLAFFIFIRKKLGPWKILLILMVIIGPIFINQIFIVWAKAIVTEETLVNKVKIITNQKNIKIERNLGFAYWEIGKVEADQNRAAIAENYCTEYCKFLLINGFVDRVYGWNKNQQTFKVTYFYWELSNAKKESIKQVSLGENRPPRVNVPTNCTTLKEDFTSFIKQYFIRYRICERDKKFFFAIATLVGAHPYLPFGNFISGIPPETTIREMLWHHFFNN